MKLSLSILIVALSILPIVLAEPSYYYDCMSRGIAGYTVDQLQELCKYPPEVRRCILGGLIGVPGRDLPRRCLEMHAHKVEVVYEE
ncbi:hypothetical protein Ddc_14806 [Ditylenchus destructor]|nr:hypothetical protein Ddc_14806 [Ditylenchus destructor]